MFGFTLLCMSYILTSTFVDNARLLSLGSALLLTGYGLLAYGQFQHETQSQGHEPIFQNTDVAAHASLARLSYVLSVTRRRE